MGTIVRKSLVLNQFPKRVVIITDKNFAGIGGKYRQSFSTIPGLDVRYVGARAQDAETQAKAAFSGVAHDRILALYYDPGDIQGHTDKFTERVNAPPDIPWGLLRGSSFYRVDNLVSEVGHDKTNVKVHGRYRKIVNANGKRGPVKKALTVNHEIMHAMNRHFDSLTPLILCCTEDLLGINRHSCYLGQPQEFLPYIPNKSPNIVGHITTPSRGRGYKKGTDAVSNAFAHMANTIQGVDNSIIGNPRVSHARCLQYLERLGISVLTMTSWDYGLGYIGLESLSRSCLCMARNSKYAHTIKSPIVNVSTPAELIRKVKYYNDNVNRFESDRMNQYLWALNNFTPEAVGSRFRYILQTMIDDGWRHGVRPGLREI